MPLTVATISGAADISALEETWEGLFRAGDNEPSTSYEWTAALLRNHVHPADRPFVLSVARGADIVALVPLVAFTVRILGYPVAMLTPLSERYGTHSDVLGTLDDEVVEALVRALFTLDVRWDVFRAGSVLEQHPLIRHVPGTLRRPLSWHVRNSHASYVLDLPGTFQRYLSERSGRFRNHLNRTVRKIESGGDTQVVEIESPADVARGFEMLLEIERASWKHAHGTAISAVPHQAAFYRDLCEGAAAQGRLHLQLLLMAGHPVAYNLGYLHKGAYAYLKTSYRDSHKQAGVATYLRARLFETLVARGVRVVDFPAEPYEWERQWTSTVRWNHVLSLYRPTPAGLALAVADRVRHRGHDDRAVHHADPRALKARLAQ